MYPGPEYLRTGEYGECEHGTPDNHDCSACLAERVKQLDEENERLLTWLDRIEGGDHPCDDPAQLRQWAHEAAMSKRWPDDEARGGEHA